MAAGRERGWRFCACLICKKKKSTLLSPGFEFIKLTMGLQWLINNPLRPSVLAVYIHNVQYICQHLTSSKQSTDNYVLYPGARAEKCHLLHTYVEIVEKFKSEQNKSGVKMPIHTYFTYSLNLFHYLNAIYIHMYLRQFCCHLEYEYIQYIHTRQ